MRVPLSSLSGVRVHRSFTREMEGIRDPFLHSQRARPPSIAGQLEGRAHVTFARRAPRAITEPKMSGRSPELDDGKMSAAVDVRDDEPHGRQTSKTSSPGRPSLTHSGARERLIRRRTAERPVGPVVVVPEEVSIELAFDERDRERKDDQAEALVLHGEEEALDDGDAAGLPHGSEARSNAVRRAPGPILLLELRAVVGDRVARGPAALRDRAVEDGEHLGGGGLLREDAARDDAAREVIEDDGDPGAERPALREGKGEPRDPEAERGRDDREIDVPEVFGVAGEHDTAGRAGRFRSFFALVRLGIAGRPCPWHVPFEHSLHGGGGEDEPRACEHLGDADLAEEGTDRAELLHHDGDEVREAVHRRGQADERSRPLFVEASHPGGDRRGGEKERLRGLSGAPAASGSEREDRHPELWRITGPLCGGDEREPRILDAKLLPKEGDLLAEVVSLGPEPHACDAAVGAPRPCAREREVRHRDDVQKREARVLRPVGWERNRDGGRAEGHREAIVALAGPSNTRFVKELRISTSRSASRGRAAACTMGVVHAVLGV